MKKSLTCGFSIAVLTILAGPALAATDVYLIAKPFTKDLPGGVTVPMWGYALDTGGSCYNATTTPSADTNCTGPVAAAPGPQLEITIGDPDVNIYLTNLLPEGTSIVIPGQKNPVSGTAGPTWNDGSTGGRTDLAQRVRSFGAEAAADGKQSYSWSTAGGNEFARTGSFIYHSGTSPQKQVYMGLYGAATKDVAAGEAYAGVAYAEDVVLFYSDIDTRHNASVDDGSYTTSINYQAQWFLINGEPYSTAMAAGEIAGAPGGNTLLRLFSTASETHVPTLQGLYMNIHAEDGFVYNYQSGLSGVVGANVPRTQYSVMMPPLKTKDAIITAANEGTYAIYDGNGYMTNPSDPNAADPLGDDIGGMLRFLTFTAPAVSGFTEMPGGGQPGKGGDVLLASRDVYYLTRMGRTEIPVSRSVLRNDDSRATSAQLVSDPTRGQLDVFNADGSFTYTISSRRTGEVARFEYRNGDGNSYSETETVILRRHLSVKSASCTYDAAANVCDWQISGWITRATPDGTTIEVRLGGRTGPLIGTVVKDGATFNLTVDNSPVIAGSGSVIDVQAVGKPTAAIHEFPVAVSW